VPSTLWLRAIALHLHATIPTGGECNPGTSANKGAESKMCLRMLRFPLDESLAVNPFFWRPESC